MPRDCSTMLLSLLRHGGLGGWQLPLALNRLKAGNLALGFPDLARRFQTLGGGLEAKMEEVLQFFLQRKIQLFIAHAAVLSRLHSRLSSRRWAAASRSDTGTAFCRPRAPGNRGPPTPGGRRSQTGSCPV